MRHTFNISDGAEHSPSEESIRIDKAEVRLIRLPLNEPFETSFGSIDSRLIFLVSVEADGLKGWGEVVAAEEPRYSYENRRHSPACHSGFPRACVDEQTRSGPGRDGGTIRPVSRAQHGQGRVGTRIHGLACAVEESLALLANRGRAFAHPRRREPWHSAHARPAYSPGRSLPGFGLSANQAQDQTGLGYGCGGRGAAASSEYPAFS